MGKRKCYRKYNDHTCKDCGCVFSRRSGYKNTEHCIACANVRGGKTRRKHGFSNSNSRLYVTWSNMKRRCQNPKNKKYDSYGGSGITVCEEWIGFEGFMSWALSNGYDDSKYIDRKDNDKGYNPDNCRFVDLSTQNANKRITNKNKSGYIGVWFDRGKFRSNVTWQKTVHNLGRHETAKAAAIARDKFIIENDLPHTLSGIIENEHN